MSSGISFRLYIILSKSCISRLVFTDLNRIAASYPMLNPVTQSRLFLICFPQLLLANRLDVHFISSFETMLITSLFQHRLKCCNMFLCFYATIYCVAPFQEPQSLVYCCNSVLRDLPARGVYIWRGYIHKFTSSYLIAQVWRLCAFAPCLYMPHSALCR